MKGVVVLSGGMDSSILLQHTLQDYDVTSVVSFNYGQRHKKELEFAKKQAKRQDIPHYIIDLHKAGVTDAIAASGSSLVSDTEVPEGHYAEENMKATVVPNRNMMMLSIAAAIAVADEADFVTTGVHAGDHFIYPDCRPEFIGAASHAMQVGNEGFGRLQGIHAPFVLWSKADIAARGIELGVDFSETWSCYKGEKLHCGKCGTCVERLEAINEAAARIGKTREEVDTTKYEDTEFWKQAVQNAQEANN